MLYAFRVLLREIFTNSFLKNRVLRSCVEIVPCPKKKLEKRFRCCESVRAPRMDELCGNYTACLVCVSVWTHNATGCV